MEQTEIPIPIFLNEPDKILFWSWPEVLGFLSMFFLVWIICSFLLGVIVGMAFLKIRRGLQKTPLGDMTRIGVYWFLPTQKRFPSLPPSYIRELIG